MTTILNAHEFAEQTFGRANLGDARRTRRLVEAAAALANHPSESIPAACENDGARLEGFYKLIRNDDVDPTEIQRSAFDATAQAMKCVEGDLVLIQDTTSISPVHPLRELLRTKPGSPAGYQVHTGLIVEAERGIPIGVLGQLTWSRKAKKSQKLFDVESEKWQRLDEQIQAQDVAQERLIRVADRESDCFDYIRFLDQNRHRFVLRAAKNRRITPTATSAYLWQAAQRAPIMGMRAITVEQRGGQKKGLEQSARDARPRHSINTTLRAATVDIKGPSGKTTIQLNVVLVTGDAGNLEWMLLTREPIATLADVERVVSHYEKRWLIEQFHKSWKSGCKIEERRMGSLDNFLRIMAITGHIAVRLLQLQVVANLPDDAVPATAILSLPEIKVLWAKTERSPFPKKMPTARWGYVAIAKIAGWQDSKRTGRVGIDTLWRGLQRLGALAEGWRMATAAQK